MHHRLAPRPALAFGRRGALGLQAAQQLGGGFIVRVLRHQFTAKRLGQQRGGQARGGGLRLGQAGFEPVGKGEQGFYAADDFGLFFGGRNRYGDRIEIF